MISTTSKAARWMQGYVVTTIAAISEADRIPAQTIYAAFGNKPAILREISRRWMTEADTRRLSNESLEIAAALALLGAARASRPSRAGGAAQPSGCGRPRTGRPGRSRQ